MLASTINLAMITIERYLKVVHPVWSNNNRRGWMIYLAIAFAWICSIISNFALVFPTTTVVDGACYAFAIWRNDKDRLVVIAWNFVCFYVVILLIFVFCYWRILIAIRRQARTMAGHSVPGSNAAQTQSNQIQTNVIKTMILVSAFYAISWMPNYVCILFLSLSPNPKLPDSGYYASVFIVFIYSCANPFIYATKFNPVKQILIRMIPCKKTSQQATVHVINVGTSTVTARGLQVPN